MGTLDADVHHRGAQAAAVGKGLGVVLGAFLVASAITIPVSQVFVDLGLVARGEPGWQVVRTVLQFGGFLLAVFVFLHLFDEWQLVPFGAPTRTEGLLAIGGVGALLVLQFAILAVFGFVGVSTGENQAMLPGRENPTYFLYMIVVSILVVGPVEEVLFRGVVQGLFRRVWSAWPAIVFAAAIFGAVHVIAVQGSPDQQLLYATVAMILGCLLGYVYERTGNIVVPSLTHGLYNASLFAIQYLYWAGYGG